MDAWVAEAPEQGELILATVENITHHGLYVSLDEYGKMPGFVHISELSTGWVRHIEKFAKIGEKMVLKVIRINKARREVDLSLRQVTGEEKREKLIEVKKAEKAEGIYMIVKEKLKLSSEEAEKEKDLLIEEFGSLHEALEEIARKGSSILEKLGIPVEHAAVWAQLAKEKIVIPTVFVKGVIQASVKAPDGVEVLKKAFMNAESVKTGGSKVTISYISAPKYRIIVEAENYKLAEKALDTAIAKAKEIIEKSRGAISFTRTQSRK